MSTRNHNFLFTEKKRFLKLIGILLIEFFFRETEVSFKNNFCFDYNYVNTCKHVLAAAYLRCDVFSNTSMRKFD